MRGLLLLSLLGCHPPEDSAVTETADSAAVEATPYTSSHMCGTCHPTQLAQWEQSMHRYGARSPVFDPMTLKAFRDSSGAVGTFCTRCHAPFGDAEGEPGFTTSHERSELSLEGVSCDFCHSATGHTDGIIGNTEIEATPTDVKYGPFQGSDYGVHSGQYSTFTTSPELCGSCHDVFAFPGLRIEEAYSEYAQSPAAKEGIRCQDCHMGPEPGVPSERSWGPAAVVNGVPTEDRALASHRFIGPDYSLLDNFPYDDAAASAEAVAEYKEQVKTLLGNAVKLNQVVAQPSAEGAPPVITLGVKVQSLTKGHQVPTGFSSERQLWLEVTVLDDTGAVVFQSGDLDENSDLRDVHSDGVAAGRLPLDEQLVNYQSVNLLRQRDFEEDGTFEHAGDTAEAAAFESETMFPFEANTVIKRGLEPEEIRLESYTIPVEGHQRYTVTVRLRWRHLPPYLLRALQVDHLVERVDIFELDQASAEVRLP